MKSDEWRMIRLLDAARTEFNHWGASKIALIEQASRTPEPLPAMTSRLLTASVLLGGALFVSCVPYPEPGRGDPRKGDPNAKVMTPAELEAKKADELKKKEETEKAKREKELAGGDLNNPDNKIGGTGGTTGGTIPPKPGPPKKDWPFANPVPGKEGFVFSPYNNQMVDVRDIPSGTLVQDPTYPAAEQKRFRVP
jgi:hypothetical protein